MVHVWMVLRHLHDLGIQNVEDLRQTRFSVSLQEFLFQDITPALTENQLCGLRDCAAKFESVKPEQNPLQQVSSLLLLFLATQFQDM